MIDRFAELLKELGTELGIALHPDRIGACKLHINDQFHIQLECDAHQENLLVATFICDIPPGKYRENILKDGLKANEASLQFGTLAYSERNNKLSLFSYLSMPQLNGHQLAEFLSGFVEKASQWKIGVETGHTGHLVSHAPKPSPSGGMFGLGSVP